MKTKPKNSGCWLVFPILIALLNSLTISAQTQIPKQKPIGNPNTSTRPITNSQQKESNGSSSNPIIPPSTNSVSILGEISDSSWVYESLIISPDGKHYAYVKKLMGKCA